LTKASLDDLAVFGGVPLFSEIKPVGQLASPEPDRFLEEVRAIFDRRELTGNGPVVKTLEARLAALHGTAYCITVANACLGLVMMLRLVTRGRTGNVIVPAFSYSGIPHVVQWAGHMPKFCDVEELRHGLDPRSVRAAIDEKTVAILAVCNVNSACEISSLASIAKEKQLPIIFDSVSALGATYGGRMLGSFGDAEVFSLHATKMLNGFEGGYVTTNDGKLAEELIALRDGPRVNASLNEIHAALALLSLDMLDEIVERNRKRYEAYASVCARIAGLDLVPYVHAERERYTYQMAFAHVHEPWPLTREATIRVLRAENAFAMPYYSPPLHRSSHCPPGMIVPPMPVSESLAQRFMYLPVGEHTTIADVEALGELLEWISGRGDELRVRLRDSA
jgi:dTDP-4-amino-4,6-dideoxyglucose